MIFMSKQKEIDVNSLHKFTSVIQHISITPYHIYRHHIK